MNCAVHPNIPASAYCRTCGKALCENCKRDVKGVIFCQDCLAARLEGAVPVGAALPPGTVVPPPPLPEGAPNPAVALVLGFIPGVGAFYNGQFAKGFIHVVIFAILIKLADVSGMFGVMIAAWYFYMIFDAYKTAKARQMGLPLPDPLGLNNLFGIQESTPAPVVNAPISGGTAQVPPPTAYVPAVPQYVPASTQRRAPLAAIFLIGFGVLFLLDNLGFFHWYWAGRYWPVILIVLGLWIAAKRASEARIVQEQRPDTAQNSESSSSEANHG
jgi:TM2 domain-containing membrane protein YozV